MSAQHAQYVLLFLVLAVNSDKFQNLQIELHALTLAARSYVLRNIDSYLGPNISEVPMYSKFEQKFRLTPSLRNSGVYY